MVKELIKKLRQLSKVGFGYDLTKEDKQALIEAAEALARPEAAQVRVKRLNFEPINENEPLGDISALSIFGEFIVQYDEAFGWLCNIDGFEDSWVKYPSDDEGFGSRIDALEECNRDNARRILSGLEQPNTVAQPDGWRDISTAPKGNKDVLVGWYSDHYEKFVWTRAGQVNGIWYVSGGTGTVCYPTHWMPLPPAPEKEG